MIPPPGMHLAKMATPVADLLSALANRKCVHSTSNTSIQPQFCPEMMSVGCVRQVAILLGVSCTKTMSVQRNFSGDGSLSDFKPVQSRFYYIQRWGYLVRFDLRASLEEAETDIDQLEAKLERLVKLCNGMIDAGKGFNNANSAFIHGVKDVADHFREDELVSDDNIVAAALARFTQCMVELQKYHAILLDQANRSICKNLNNFLKNEVRKVKDTRRHFEKISGDMDAALLKNAQAPRSKPPECEDANNVLTAMRSAFGHTSLDYVFQINILHSKKRFDVLDTMLAYMHAQNAYFHQGSDLFADLEPYMKQVAAQIEQLSSRAALERKEMEERHTLVQQRVSRSDKIEELCEVQNGNNCLDSITEELSLSTPFTPQSDNNEIKMEGYLYKRTTNAFKSWVRRWFQIQKNQLVYRKRSKDNLTVMEDDLRLCTVKPTMEIDRRFCFEVVSPARSHMLQADSENECAAWINAIQAGVSKAYRDATQEEDNQPNNSPPGNRFSQMDKKESPAQNRSPSRMEQLLAIPGNNNCCDCGSSEPRWASINLGITLCIECSGIHRSFGVHMSKVRSVTLDAWEPEQLKVMAELGNMVVNRIYECEVDESIVKRATPHCNRDEREVWIKAKYIQKAFVRKLPKPGETNTDAEPTRGKMWSVCKKKRRSPSKSKETETPEAEKRMLQGESQDSGLGGSTPDVIVFGATVNSEQEDAARSLDLDLEESGSEPEADQDSGSTTSFEDFSKLHPDLLLYKAAQARNLPVILEALGLGASPNWHNPDDNNKTPLMKVVESGSMAACELLLLNGAKLDRKDNRGRTPLHHATLLGHTGQVCQFLKRNANQHAVDVDGKNPLEIAIMTANADIVTLLRLAKLNEEMKETDPYSGQGDETFNEVFRDFTNMANNAPEKLNRNK